MRTRLFILILLIAAIASPQLLGQTLTLTTTAPGTPLFGAPMTLTAILNPAGGTGAVTFYDGATILGVRPVSAGAASLTTTLLAAGNRKLRAYYAGDSSHSPLTSNVVSQKITVVASTTFSSYPIAAGWPSAAVAVADFNGDGKQDIAIGLSSGGQSFVSILLGNGDGTFQSPRSAAGIFAAALVAPDFNGDGKTDLAVASNSSAVTILLGNGDGTFQPAVSYPTPDVTSGLAVGDFNGDGKADLVTCSNASAILIGNGDGTFQPAAQLLLGTATTSVAVGDFNGDGKADIAFSNVLVLLGNGNGTFQPPVTYHAGITPGALAVGDFNGDGIADLAVTCQNTNNVFILLGNGNGTFQTAVSYAVGSGPSFAAVGNFSGGPSDELVVTNSNDGSISILENTLQLNYSFTLNPAYRLWQAAVGDFNGDGKADLVVLGDQGEPITVLLGASATLATFSGGESTYLGQPFPAPFQVIARDGNNNPLAGVPVNFAVPSSGASAVLTSASAFTNASGVAIVTGAANEIAGSYNLVAQSGSANAAFTLTNATDVPAVLTATSPPQSAAVNMLFVAPLQVLLKDAAGNPVGGAAVNFSAPSTGAGALLSPSTAITNSSGVAYVLATANAAQGSYVVTASFSGLSATLSLTNLPATGVDLSSSANPVHFGAGITLNVTVTPSSATGKVTFYDGMTVLGVKPVLQGGASLPVLMLKSGSRKLIAYYSGDGNNPASNSNVVTETVNALSGTTFVPGTSPTVGSNPWVTAVADLNGDGMADVVVGDINDYTITVLLGNGDGTFRGRAYSVYPGPTATLISDFNGDGIPDVAVLGGYSMTILFGNGDGSLGSSRTITLSSTYPASQIVAADFNRDGKVDLLVAFSGFPPHVPNIGIMLGNGDGTFQAPVMYTAGLAPVVAVADLNGDGKADIVAADTATTDYSVFVLMGNGDGTFQSPVSYPVQDAQGILVDDFNLDGKPDVVVLGAPVSIMLGNGDGTLQPAAVVPGTSAFYANNGAVADFNGDGVPDMFLSDGLSGELFFGNGNGTFQTAIPYSGVANIAAADFNGDGRVDIVAVNHQSLSISILLGAAPVLKVAAAHSGILTAGQTGVVYTLTVSNAGLAATTGLITLTDSLSGGMTATAIGGYGWSCTLATPTCTRSDSLAAGGTYPAISVTVNITGSGGQSLTNQAAVQGGGSVSANASDVTTIAAIPNVVSVTPSSGSGMSQTFSFVFSDVAGYQDMVWQQVLISGTGAAACHVFASGSQVYLFADNGSSAFGPLTLGTSGTLANSQCTLNVGSSSTVGSGNTLTVNLVLTFQASFAGSKSVLAAVASAEGLNSGWQTVGSWITSNPMPTVVSVTPSSGSGTSQTFTFAFSDAAGYQDMVWQQVLISGSGGAACHVFSSGNQVFLMADNGSSALGPLTLATSGTLANSQCTLNAGSSSIVGSGNTLTLNLALTFQASFAGTKSILAAAASTDGLNSGWQTVGSWTPTMPVPSVVSASPSSGAGLSQTFNFVFSDPAGWADMAWQQVLISANGGLAGACHLFFNGVQLYLGTNDGGGSLGPALLGHGGSLQNGQCTVNLGGSQMIGSGNTVALSLALSFEASFAGLKTIWAAAGSVDGSNSGWQVVGSWTTSMPAPSVVSVNPGSGGGLSQTFSFAFSDPAGYQDMVWEQVLISGSGSAACHLFVSGNQVYLIADNGSSGLGPLTLGTSGTLANSQCTLNAGSSSAVGSGTMMTLHLALTFQPSFVGALSVVAAAASAEGLNSGWQTVGSWTTSNPVPTVASVTPASGSGLSQTFSFAFSDAAGYQDMVWQQVLISGSGSAACHLFASGNQVYLMADNGSSALGPLTLGTSGTLSNSQCSLNAGSSSAVGSGDLLTLNLALTFQASFSGAKSVNAAAASADGLNSGWQTVGSWTPE